MNGVEVNFDGLVGPTHNYSGLSLGNVASIKHSHRISNPQMAAKQGLAKMKALHDLGYHQGILVPHERPDIARLRRLGFTGSDATVLAKVAHEAPCLLAAVSSASAMWVANAATVSPSADTDDGRVHFTPANLNTTFHRSIEHFTTQRVLSAVFANEAHFVVHDALPAHPYFADEGAANHTRLCGKDGEPGLELFVFGTSLFHPSYSRPCRFPARQTLEASEAIARRHGLIPEQVVFAQQRPDSIDQGVFHNDVIAVGHRHILFLHEKAFVDQARVLAEMDKKMRRLALPFLAIEVAEEAVSVEDAVNSYLFNSQLISRPDGKMTLVVPDECRQHPKVRPYLEKLIATDTNPIVDSLSFDLKQSMQNGGGPACLRLRVVMTEAELAAVNPAVMMSDALFERLMRWIDRYYRDRLAPADLADPLLLTESRAALDELTKILNLGSIYPFQRIE